MTIERVAVIGGGTMGSGIAEVCAIRGVDTKLVEISAELAETAKARIDGSMERAVGRGKLGEEDRDAAAGRLAYTTDRSELVDRQLVIEAVIESPELKIDIFRDLDAILGDDAIIASNTSSISIGLLGSVTERPDRVAGMHFFNPATVQPLVELIASLDTDGATMDAIDRFATDRLGKTTIRCPDRAGFVVNRLLVPYLLAAIRLYDEMDVSAEDIDAGMKNGCAHPMGPLELCDLIGLDVIKLVADVLYDEFAEPTYAAPPLLLRMVTAGHLGRKTGRGFYSY